MDPNAIHSLALAVTVLVALERVAVILATFFGRTLRERRRAAAAPRRWRAYLTYPEPPLLAVVVLGLWWTARPSTDVSGLDLARACGAAGLALAGLGLQLWVLRTFSSVPVGHYVREGQELVTSGPYALVRHPLYLQAMAVWAATALAFWSGAALAIGLLYVVPAYVVYGRAEDRMLLAQMGEAYRRYRRRVPAFVPRWRGGGDPA